MELPSSAERVLRERSAPTPDWRGFRPAKHHRQPGGNKDNTQAESNQKF